MKLHLAELGGDGSRVSIVGITYNRLLAVPNALAIYDRCTNGVLLRVCSEGLTSTSVNPS